MAQVVTLRGLNLPINGKTPNFMPLMNKTGLETLQLYGTSVARVPFTWEAYEPERGQFNTEYLQYYQGIVEVKRASMRAINHAAMPLPVPAERCMVSY
jgi:hypothetical protein